MERNRITLNKKRKYESTTHILPWESVERPTKIPRAKIHYFQEWYSFKVLTYTTVEVSKPVVKLGPKKNGIYPVQDWWTEYDDIKFRSSQKKEKRKTKIFVFKNPREQEI